MIIAYVLAKYEEDNGATIDWLAIIKGGIYEFLRRIIISDIQSPVFRELSKNAKLVQKLNTMIYNEVESSIGNPEIKEEFKRYLLEDGYIPELELRILNASHRYSSYWEFQIVRDANPNGYQIRDIEIELGKDLYSYSDLIGINKLLKKQNIKNFIDLCAELRYQVRWGHLPRIPKTSVLGHVMLVATLSYFVTKEMENPAPKRIYNNFFGGLFHDLPEALTRDIIKPVKMSVPGMQEEIRRIEKQLTEAEIYPNLEPHWLPEIKFFTQSEFSTKILDGQTVSPDDINLKYNEDRFNPYDGNLLKGLDDFAAFLEAWSSIDYGIRSSELEQAKSSIKQIYKDRVIGGFNFNEIFNSFE
jgi:putative hydrolase of HD superfamily